MTVLSVSCTNGEDEKAADQFHEKLDAGEYEWIVDNLVYPEDLVQYNTRAEWMAFFELVQSWGPIINRKAQWGFSTKVQNGVTTSRIGYEFDNDKGHFYERLVLVDRGEGFKLLVIAINTDEATVERQTAGF